MPTYWTYVIYTAVIAVIMVVVVPRHEIRRLAVPAILAGGVGDIALVLLLKPIGAGAFQNFGPFGFMGIPFFPPIAWTLFFIIYFYFLPIGSLLIYPYVAASAGYAILFGNVLVNLGILWYSNRVMVPLLVYPLWFPLVTFLFLKFSQREES